ncbi:MAG: serine/threonine-protein kinase [Mycobacteriales bacterium]
MTTPTSIPGRSIGQRYALLHAVGAGGMGTVWRAHDQLLRRDVAVKEVLLPAGLPQSEHQMLCERTLREARAAASLNNPAVIQIYDVVEEDDRPWIIMELVAARSLAEIINERGPMPPHVVADVGLQVLGAIEAAHAAGILHRDVKPGNILLSEDGRATLTDFGVARSSGDSALTSTGLLLGSPSYIPPERAKGEPAVPASDLWALGATLYAAVEGHPPYDKGDPVGTLTAIVSDPPPSFALAGPVQQVLAGLLEKDIDRRWDITQARNGFRHAIRDSRAAVTSHIAVGATRTLGPFISTVASPPAGQPVQYGAAAGQQAPPPPSRRHERRGSSQHPKRGRQVALAVTLVLALGVVATGAALYLNRDRSPSPNSTPSPATASGPITPAGYFRFTHPDGFSVAVPDGWRQETLSSGIIQFRDPQDTSGGGRFLRLSASKSGGSLVAYWKGADARGTSTIPGYRLLAIRDAKVGARTGSEWEFTHTLSTNRHVIDRAVLIDGTIYAFYLSTREEQFGASANILDKVADSFALEG